MAKNQEEEILDAPVEEEQTPPHIGRWYYKAKNGKGYLDLKNALDPEKAKDYIEITKEEFDELTHVEPHEPTQEELEKQAKKNQISHLKNNLAKTDYIVIKIAEAETTEEQNAIREEYAEVIANRKTWRTQINALETELGGK